MITRGKDINTRGNNAMDMETKTLKEGQLSEKKCGRCGDRLPVSGGLIGWNVTGVKGLFCASCAGHIIYPRVCRDPSCDKAIRRESARELWRVDYAEQFVTNDYDGSGSVYDFVVKVGRGQI
jgi:hypothetical protein